MERESGILIIDDDVDLASNLKVILEDEGYFVTVVHNGREAIDLCRRNEFMVSLSDIKLPDVSGVELAGQLAQVSPAMDTILVTGYAALDTALAAVGNRNIIAYKTKPLDIDDLLIFLRQVVERKHAEAELIRYRERLELLVEERTDELRLANRELQNEIAQRKKAEKTARGSERQLLSLINSMDDLVFVFGMDGVFLRYYQPSKKDILYTPPEEFIGRHFSQVLPPHIADQMQLALDDIQVSGEPQQFDYNMEIGGNQLWFNAKLSASKNSSGDIVAVTAVVRDITERKHIQEAESRARELEELNRLRSAILASVSHELRTPLAAIKGLAESLVQADVEWDTETQQEWLRTINRESDTLTRIVEDLVQMSQLEAGIMTMNKLPTTISAIIDRLDHQFKILAKDHALQLDVPDGLPQIEVDEVRIGQVISNLVSNAAFYSSPGTRILLAVRQAGDEIIVSVTDEGIGIASEHQQKIFDRFYRVESGVFHRRGGTGLGLSICRGILDSHGGRIWVESGSEGGSTFSFSLPVN